MGTMPSSSIQPTTSPRRMVYSEQKRDSGHTDLIRATIPVTSTHRLNTVPSRMFLESSISQTQHSVYGLKLMQILIFKWKSLVPAMPLFMPAAEQHRPLTDHFWAGTLP